MVEVPITFVEREHGDSKMSRDILVEALWRVTTWGVGERVNRARGKTRSRSGLSGYARTTSQVLLIVLLSCAEPGPGTLDV